MRSCPLASPIVRRAQYALQANITAQQIIQPRTANKVTVQTNQRWRLSVVETQLKIQHFVNAQLFVCCLYLLRQKLVQVNAIVFINNGKQGRNMILRIDGTRAICFASFRFAVIHCCDLFFAICRRPRI